MNCRDCSFAHWLSNSCCHHSLSTPKHINTGYYYATSHVPSWCPKLGVPRYDVATALVKLTEALGEKLNTFGDKPFNSPHEILGQITEEYHEIIEAVHDNDREALAKELLDIAVAATFSYACVKSEKMPK